MTERQPIATEVAPPEIRKSKGDKLFDWLVYGGLNYLGTFALTVVVADWLQTHQWGKNLCNWGKESLMRASVSEKTADAVVTTTLLMQGGTLMLAPIHALEKRRTGIVDWLNRKFGDTTAQTTRHADVPQQSWGSLIKGRLVAWSVVFASMVGAEWALTPERFKAFSDNTGRFVAKHCGVPEAARNETSRAFRYGKLGALDAFATLASSILLYTTSKFFARRHDGKLEDRRDNAPSLPQPLTMRTETKSAASASTPSVTTITGRYHQGAMQTAPGLAAPDTSRYNDF